jgi:transcriptional regulator with XRE-family HTH domain
MRYFRKLRGLTQGELGAKVGLPANRIQKYESGVRNPKEGMLKLLADALDVDAGFLSSANNLTPEMIMFVMFELEEKYDAVLLSPEELCFNKMFLPVKQSRANVTLRSYLQQWYEKRLDWINDR